MKTPEEIKKGLEQYMSVDAYDCEISCKDSGCPYSGDERIGAETCGDLICADVLAYIQRLEERNTWHEGNEKYLKSFMDDLSKQITQLVRERDALMYDMQLLTITNEFCNVCKHCNPDEDVCSHVTAWDEKCFAWRGLCKENGGIEA